MCELEWYALAEIHLKNQEKPQEIYCLCSRVFIRNKDDNLKRIASSADLSASEDELLIEDEVSSECNSLPTISKNKIKQVDVEHETVSCYCSASHTDNLSTDEHDSLRDSHDARGPFKALQSCDSGADLTECIKHDIDTDWQKFWSLNGEKLIWESWIAKYSAYINPDYLQIAQDQADTDSKTEKLAFDKRDLLTLDIEPVNKPDSLKTIDENSPLPREPTGRGEIKNKILVRNLSGSDDKLNADVSEGWNPLSPLSVDCETEIEQLLSSRCGSHASSSLRTVDSMTNVTRMTISSLDLSESSHSSESFSSVSSVQSSLSSTSSEDIEEDYHQQWNGLWKRHYEEAYLRQYQLFVDTWKEHNFNDEAIRDKFDSETALDASKFPTSSFDNRLTKENIHKVFQGKVDEEDVKDPIEVSSEVASSLGDLLDNLKMESEENTMNRGDDECGAEAESECESIEDDNNDVEQMTSMGLPMAFGNGHKRSRVAESDFSDSLPPNLTDEYGSARKRIKTAFNMMGIQYQDTKISAWSGAVEYKSKRIRLQNRHLRFRSDKPPTHVFFDDEGNSKPVSRSPDFYPFYSSDNKQSSGDDEIVSNKLATSDNKQSSGDDEIVSNKLATTPPKTEERKKRKKKIVVPQEIKDNPHLEKYWYRRHALFSKFEEGIKLDEESWYSVTPEQLAIHLAERCKCDVIVDGFCGAGGNTIQFAFTCKKVIAIDIDPKKIELARNNARVYGVEDRIEFIVGDFLELAGQLKADVVFCSPPWGGPSYLKKRIYNLETMLLPVPMSKLLDAARKITSNIAVFLPKNSNSCCLIDESLPSGGVEIEQNFVSNILTAITAYYSDLIRKV